MEVNLFLKVKVNSNYYKGEYIGIQYNSKKETVEIGGKEKMQFEIEALISKLSNVGNISNKVYTNNIIRKVFTLDIQEFKNWIDLLKSHSIELSYVNSLERIMR